MEIWNSVSCRWSDFALFNYCLLENVSQREAKILSWALLGIRLEEVAFLISCGNVREICCFMNMDFVWLSHVLIPCAVALPWYLIQCPLTTQTMQINVAAHCTVGNEGANNDMLVILSPALKVRRFWWDRSATEVEKLYIWKLKFQFFKT